MQSLSSVVTDVKNSMREGLSPTAYNLWVSPVTPISMIDSTVYLYLKSDFHKDIFLNRYLDSFSRILQDNLGFSVSFSIISQEDIEKGDIPAPLLSDSNFVKEYLKEKEVKKTKPKEEEFEHSFDNFIVGNSNNFAYSASKAVAQKVSFNQYNPLFIYGESGLGKTHLLLAIKNEVLKNHKNLNVLYTTGETFGNELIDAIANQTTAQFHKKYRNMDYLLMDDVQFIAGKNRMQEEFFHTFNELHQAGKQIVLTSDRPPKDIKILEDRLKTRFEWGLLADISPPDYETRIAIIKKKTESLDIEVNKEICEYVAKNLKENIRQLEGVVKKIKAYKILVNKDPDLPKTQSFIKEVLNNNKPPSVTVDNIINEVCKTYNVTSDDLKSNKRNAFITTARQAAIYIIRKTTNLTYEEIGEYFSNRDHSTITYSLNKIEETLKKDSNQRDIVNDIIKNVKQM